MKRRYRPSLVYLCATAVLAAAQLPPAASSDYNQGIALIQKGQFETAIPFLSRAVESNPKNARAWKALGTAYAAQSLYELADRPFEQACRLDPNLDDACYYHGRTLYSLDRFEQSLQVLEKVLRQDATAWRVRLAVAQALEALGDPRRAESEFRKSIADCRWIDPRPGTAFGLFLVRQGRFGEAVEPLEEVLKRFPSAADAHVHLGRALNEIGREDQARLHFEQAVRFDPTSAQAHLLLGKAYLRAGRQAEAQSQLEAAARYEAGSRNVK